MPSPARTPLPLILDSAERGVADALFSAPFGLFARQKIRAMIGRKLIRAEAPLDPSNSSLRASTSGSARKPIGSARASCRVGGAPFASGSRASTRSRSR